jgi:hypothetical protein
MQNTSIKTDSPWKVQTMLFKAYYISLTRLYAPEGSINGRSMNILMHFKMFNNMAANRK